MSNKTGAGAGRTVAAAVKAAPSTTVKTDRWGTISDRAPGRMTGSELTKEQDRVDAMLTKVERAVRAAGLWKGGERIQDVLKKDHPLVRTWRAALERRDALRDEVGIRYNGRPASFLTPSRLPYGIGRKPRIR